MTEFQVVVLAIMGFCTVSVALNAYFAYKINKIERKNEYLSRELTKCQSIDDRWIWLYNINLNKN